MAVNTLLSRISLAVVPPLYLGLTRLLFATVREESPGIEHYERLLAGGQPFIACQWHYSLLYGIHRIIGRDWVFMVSRSADAEYISRTLIRMGHATVRGSRGKGGIAALKEMMAAIKGEGKRAGIVADGSQGPPLQLQAGVILLAAKTGVPILPLAWGADRFWAFRSWDRTALPKPFARVSLCFGEPLLVPNDLTANDLERYRQLLEVRMRGLYTQAWGRFDRPGHTDQAPPPFTGGGWGVGEGTTCQASANFPPTPTLPRQGRGGLL